MSITVRGIEYRFSVKVGRSISNMEKLAAALVSLDAGLTRLLGHLGVVSEGTNSLATASLNQAAATNRATQSVSSHSAAHQVLSAALGATLSQTSAVTGANAQYRRSVSSVVKELERQKAAEQALARELTDRQSRVLAMTNKLRGFGQATPAFDPNRATDLTRKGMSEGMRAWSTQVGQAIVRNKELDDSTRGLTESQRHWSNAVGQSVAQQQSALATQRGMSDGMRAWSASVGRAIDDQRRLRDSTREVADGWSLLGGIIGGTIILRAIRNATLLAGRVENLETVMNTVGRTAAVSRGEMFATEQQMKKLGITTQVSREILTRFAQNNLRVADSLRIARIAQDAAVVAGINSSVAAERMMVAVQRLDTRMLRNLGILINLRAEYQKYAIVTGRLENSLTANEKQQIVLNAVMRSGAALAGAYESALQDVFKQFTTLERKFEEASRTVGEHWLPTFQVLVNISDEFLDAVAAQRGGLDTLIHLLMTAGGGLGLAGILIGVARGWQLLSAAMLANPYIAVTAGVVTLTVALLDLAAANERMIAAQIRQVDKQAFERQTLRDLTEEYRRLAAVKERSPQQEQDFVLVQQRINDLLTEQEKRVLQTASNWQEYADAIGELERLGSPIKEDDAVVLGKIADRLKFVTTELEALRAHSKTVNDPQVSNALGFRIRQLENERRILQSQTRALEEQRDLTALRRLRDLAVVTENLDIAAKKASDSIQRMNIKKLSEGSDDLIKRIELVRQLAAQTLSLSQIEQKYRLEVASAQRNFDANVERERANKSGSELQESIDKLTQQHQMTMATLKVQRENEKKAFGERQAALKESIQLNTEGLAEMRQGILDQAQAMKFAEMGLEQYGEAVVDITKVNLDFTAGVRALDKTILEQEQGIAGLLDAMAGGNFSNDDDLRAAEARLKIAQQQLALSKELRELNVESVLQKLDIAFVKAAEAMGADVESLDKLNKATQLMRFENGLLAQGIEDGVVSAMVKAVEQSMEFEEAADRIATANATAKKRIEELEADRLNATTPDQIRIIDAELQRWKTFAGQLKSLWKEVFENRMEEQNKSDKEIAAAEKKAQEESQKTIRDSARKKIEEIKKSLEEATNKVKKITDDIRQATNNTAEGMLKLRIDRGDFGVHTQAVKTGFDLYERFNSLIGGAGTQEQLDALLKGKGGKRGGKFDPSEFDKSFRAIFGEPNRNRRGEVVGNGFRENLYRQIRQELETAFKDRSAELTKQNDELIAAQKTADEAVIQSKLLGELNIKFGDMTAALEAMTPKEVQDRLRNERNARAWEQWRNMPANDRASKKAKDEAFDKLIKAGGNVPADLNAGGMVGNFKKGISPALQSFLGVAVAAAKAMEGMVAENKVTDAEMVANMKKQGEAAKAAGEAAKRTRDSIKRVTDDIDREMKAQGLK